MIAIRNAALAATAALTLAACTTDPAPEMPAPGGSAGAGTCDPAAAAALAGQPRPTDEAARSATGATSVRQIGPGDAVTQDFRVDRVTIETDPATGNVVRASCG